MAEQHRRSISIAVLIEGKMPAAIKCQQLHQQKETINTMSKNLASEAVKEPITLPHAHTRHLPSVLLSMNENSQPGFGKISVHGEGMGAPTPELVEKRAREIALINERDPEEFTDEDWEQARRELLGTDVIAAADDTDELVDSLSDRDSVPGDTGHRAPRAGLEDDEALGAQLVTGGLEEAAHDQMVEAAKEDQAQEG